MDNFKEWDLTYKVKLVSTGNLNIAMLHELITKAMQSEAGSIGYLMGESWADLNDLGEEK